MLGASTRMHDIIPHSIILTVANSKLNTKWRVKNIKRRALIKNDMSLLFL